MEKIMEGCIKKLLFGITVLALALAFTSCGSLSVVIVDETLPPEKTASVRFHDMDVLQYNGKRVKNWKIVKIPEGKAEFLVNLHGSDKYVYYTLYDKTFSYTLEGGKEYSLIGGRSPRGDWTITISNGGVILDTIDVTPEQPKRDVMTAGSN